MKVKKYPQSHLIITGERTKIIIDPGSITFAQGFTPEQFQGADAYLITHQHADHMDPDKISGVVKRGKAFGSEAQARRGKVYGNADVVGKLSSLGVEATTVEDRQKFTVGEFGITPVDLPHCKMQDGSDGPPNTGFLIDGVFFHPGDGDKAPDITSENLALPIAGPSITMDGALQFAQDIQAKVVIPIHYDSRFPASPEQFKNMAASFGIEVRPLKPGEETTV